MQVSLFANKSLVLFSGERRFRFAAFWQSVWDRLSIEEDGAALVQDQVEPDGRVDFEAESTAARLAEGFHFPLESYEFVDL